MVVGLTLDLLPILAGVLVALGAAALTGICTATLTSIVGLAVLRSELGHVKAQLDAIQRTCEARATWCAQPARRPRGA